jgi:hypothetical protein
MDLFNVKFLFDNQLIAALEKLIKESRHELFLISPFIDLDNRIKDALKEKITLQDFTLKVLFGKNEQNHLKSINLESLTFLKQFPNIEIRHNQRLHAKFYLNDHQYIMTSLNLYNYSLANNIEIGLAGEYAQKGLVGRLIESGAVKIDESIDKFKKNIFGISNDEDNPFEKFNRIFNDSEVIYKTSPILIEQNGIKGIFGGKKMDGFKIETEKITDKPNYAPKYDKIVVKSKNARKLSVNQIAKKFGVQPNDITTLMQKKGLIKDNQITENGSKKGLEMSTYMGNKYIVYPEDLIELKEIK